MNKYYITFGYQYDELKNKYIVIYAKNEAKALDIAKLNYGNKVSKIYAPEDIFYKSFFPDGCIETIGSKDE